MLNSTKENLTLVKELQSEIWADKLVPVELSDDNNVENDQVADVEDDQAFDVEIHERQPAQEKRGYRGRIHCVTCIHPRSIVDKQLLDNLGIGVKNPRTIY